MEIMIQQRQQMSLATTMDLDRESAISKLNTFLEENGIFDPKRYFSQWLVKQGNKLVSTTYIEFAVIPSEQKGKKDVNVAKMREGQNLVIRVEKDDFEAYKIGEFNQEIDAFLKESKLRLDNAYLLPYMEMDGDEYIIYTPVK